MNILVSGAHGFVGSSLCAYLTSQGHEVSRIDRNDPKQSFPGNTFDCMVNLAARAHIMHETAEDVYRAYADINVDYSLKMVSLARKLNIKKFIYLSSVKVNGECTDIPFTESDAPRPLDNYGKTKLEAEIALKVFCETHGIEWVIIRPPLIYGPGVKANFKSLIALCKNPIPLPFASIHNKRSLISLENLNSFIALCVTHSYASNQTFLISDDHDVSTCELVCSIRKALGTRPFLLPVPPPLLKVTLRIVGKSSLSDRLLNNLQVDISKAKQLLGWQPAISFDEGIQRSVRKQID